MTFQKWYDDMCSRYSASYSGYKDLLEEAFNAGALAKPDIEEMTQNEIIRMAREAGAVERYFGNQLHGIAFHKKEWLERFAALVAEPWIETNKALAKEIIELKKQSEQKEKNNANNHT